MRTLNTLVVAAALGLGTPAKAHDLGDQAEELGDALRDFLQQMEPAWRDALGWFEEMQGIDDPRYYQLPEILPNGDIIIRRRQDAPDYAPPAPDTPAIPESDEGTVDL